MTFLLLISTWSWRTFRFYRFFYDIFITLSYGDPEAGKSYLFFFCDRGSKVQYSKGCQSLLILATSLAQTEFVGTKRKYRNVSSLLIYVQAFFRSVYSLPYQQKGTFILHNRIFEFTYIQKQLLVGGFPI